MLKKLHLIGLILSLSVLSFANEKSDAIKLVEKGRDSINSNPEIAKKYFEQAAIYFDNSGPSRDKINYLEWRALAYSSTGNCGIASNHFDEAISIAVQLHDYKKAISIYSVKVIRCILDLGGDLQESLQIALRVKEKTANSEDAEFKFLANRLLINVYWDQPEFSEEFVNLAIENHELSLETDNKELQTQATFHLAYAYTEVQKFDLAILNYQNVIKYQRSLNDHAVSASYNNLGSIYARINEYDSALHYFSLAEHHAVLENRPGGVAAANLYKSAVYKDLKQFESTLEACQKALEIFRANGILRRQELCATCITEAYEALGDKSQAYEAFRFELEIKDSLKKLSGQDEMLIVQNQFKAESRALKDSLNYVYQDEINQTKIAEQKNRTIYLIIGLVLSVLFGGFILNRFRITRKQKAIIELQKVEVARQHAELQETHKEITDSITYAKRIQNAILPSKKIINQLLPNSFVLYLPKDVVAGDFYWMNQTPTGILFAAADCTGHGVPGAMVSVVCNNALNRSVREFGLHEPAKILDKTREIVVNEFQKSDKDVKDGMDIALCHLSGKSLQFAGAHNPLWIIRSGEIIEIKADKQPIGSFDKASPFTPHSINLKSGDLVYIFSDGYVDQFGGDRGKKLKAKNMRTIFQKAAQLEVEEQSQFLETEFLKWKADYEQIDDVCVIGTKIL